MRKISGDEVRALYKSPKNDGFSIPECRLALEKEAAFDALRNASSIAHLKPVIEWLIDHVR
jgi:hypothetical protein